MAAAPNPLAAALRGAARSYELTVAGEAERERMLTTAERYALDPFALLDEGRIKIWSKEEGRVVTLHPYDHQREALAAWIDLDSLSGEMRLRFRNLVGEKSRQQGLTWIFAYGAWWAVTFHSVQGLVRARVSTEVDNGGARSNWRSFFGKVRFIDRHLPSDLPGKRPLRFVGGNSPQITNLADPESFIIGEGETTNSGRGGTFGFAILDETAFIEAGELVHEALAQACPNGRAYISTPNGKRNVFYRLVSNPPRGWRKIRVHWSQHPVCGEGAHIAGALPDECALCAGNAAGIPWDPADPISHRYPGRLASPWYEEQIIDLTDEQVAQELDIDYEASVAARVYAEASRELHMAEEPIPWETTDHLELGFDFGLACTAVPICVERGNEYIVLGYLETKDQTPDQVATALRRRLGEIGVPAKLLTTQWTRHYLAVGDPAGSSKEIGSGRSPFAEYAKQGFSLQAAPIRGAGSIQPGINAVKRLLRGVPRRLVVSPANGGELFMDRLVAHKWPTDRTGARKEGATVPEENADKHGCDAFRYLVVHKFPPPREDDGSEPAATGGAKSLREKGILSPDVRYGMHL